MTQVTRIVFLNHVFASIGLVKLGQPQTLSNLSNRVNRGSSDTTSTYRPGCLLSQWGSSLIRPSSRRRIAVSPLDTHNENKNQSFQNRVDRLPDGPNLDSNVKFSSQTTPSV